MSELNRPEITFETRLNKIKTTLNEFIDISTIQGLPHVFKARNLYSKIMWLLALSCSSIGCVYYAAKVLDEYFTFDYYTSIRKISESAPLFPAISICGYDNKNLELKTVLFFYKASQLSDWKEHFELYNDQMYGNCYRFNSGRNYFNQTIDIKNSTLVHVLTFRFTLIEKRVRVHQELQSSFDQQVY